MLQTPRMPDVSLIQIGESSVPYSTVAVGNNVIMSYTSPVVGKVYAITATGGYSVGQTFENINRLPEYLLNQYDTTNAVEILFDVRTFNTKIGIIKDGENIGVTVPTNSYYDLSTNLFYKDSLTITSTDVLSGLDGIESYVISVGALSTIYADFSVYVVQYFAYGLSDKYPNENLFNPNEGVFDASAFLNIITSHPIDEITGASISGLSGSINVFNIAELLRFAVDSNCFGNRDPSNGITASDPFNPANYGVTDGFFADDLIYIPKDGVKITLSLSLLGSTTANQFAAATGIYQDAAVNALTTPTSTFNELTGSNTKTLNSTLVKTDATQKTVTYSVTGLTKTESVPLLFRLANLSGSTIPFSVSVTNISINSISFRIRGTYTDYTVTQVNTLSHVRTPIINTNYLPVTNPDVVVNPKFLFTLSTFTDASYVSSSSTYEYIFTPYLNADQLTIVDISNIQTPNATATVSVTLGTITATSIKMSFTGLYSYVSILRNSQITVSPSWSINAYIDANLQPNTPYNYKISPYNIINTLGIEAQSNTVYTLAQISSFLQTGSTSNQLSFQITGSYTSFLVYRTDIPSTPIYTSGTGTIVNNYDGTRSETFTNTGLSQNTAYTYVVIAKNYTGATTDTIPQTFYTNPTLNTNNCTIGTQTSSSQVQLLFDGSYNYVTITRQQSNKTNTLISLVTRANNIVGPSYIDSNQITADASYTYTITPWNSSVSGNSVTMVGYVLPQMNSAVSSLMATTQSITFQYQGYYDYLKIYRDSSTTPLYIDSNANSINSLRTYYDSGLSVNTGYIYKFVPYNHLDQSGNSIRYTLYTLPTLTNAYVSIDTSCAIQFTLEGNYQYVILTRNDGIQYRTTTLNPYTFTDYNVIPDTSYTYVILPYNNAGISNPTYQYSLFVYTLPWLNPTSVKSSLISNTPTTTQQSSIYVTNNISYSVAIQYQGYFFNVDIQRDGASILPINSILQGTTYLDMGPLTSNQTYQYTILPYDPLGDLGSTCVTSITIPPILSSVMFVNNNAHVQFALTGTYDYFNVIRVDITGNQQSWTQQTGSTFIDNLSSSNDIQYTYVFTPGSNNTVLMGTTITMVVYSLPSITSLSTKNITTNSISLAMVGTYYYYLNIWRNGVLISHDISNVSTYVDTGLQSNTTYTYVTIPYNQYDISGQYLTTTATTTSSLTTATIQSTTTNSVSLQWTGTYDNVIISRPYFSVTSSDVSYTDSTNLSAGQSYNYTITSYNSVGQPGQIMNNVVAYTIPQITQTTNSSVDLSNTITLNITGGYSYVSLQRNDGWTDTVSGAIYMDTHSLLPNTDYNYVLLPYNGIGQTGSTYTYSTFTYPFIQNISYSSAVSSLSFLVEGAYTYLVMNIYDANTNILVNSLNTLGYNTNDLSFVNLLGNYSYFLDMVVI